MGRRSRIECEEDMWAQVELGEKWGKLHNDKLRDLYSSSDSVWPMKSKTIIWAGHYA